MAAADTVNLTNTDLTANVWYEIGEGTGTLSSESTSFFYVMSAATPSDSLEGHRYLEDSNPLPYGVPTGMKLWIKSGAPKPLIIWTKAS